VNIDGITIELHHGDLPEGVDFGDCVAVDSETMGLSTLRDRLCLVQLSAGDGTCHLVQFLPGDPQSSARNTYDAPNLKRLLTDQSVTKLLHYARFDVAMFLRYLGVRTEPLYCTKIASRLVRTYTDRHGLKDLCRELLSIEMSKVQQSSDWGAEDLSPEQLKYAASDVLYLHRLRSRLDEILVREGRQDLARACFGFVNDRALLDLEGWVDEDIFAY